MLRPEFEKFWIEEMLERWTDWKPSKKDADDWFYVLKNYRYNDAVEAVQKHSAVDATNKPNRKKVVEQLYVIAPASWKGYGIDYSNCITFKEFCRRVAERLDTTDAGIKERATLAMLSAKYCFLDPEAVEFCKVLHITPAGVAQEKETLQVAAVINETDFPC